MFQEIMLKIFQNLHAQKVWKISMSFCFEKSGENNYCSLKKTLIERMKGSIIFFAKIVPF